MPDSNRLPIHSIHRLDALLTYRMASFDSAVAAVLWDAAELAYDSAASGQWPMRVHEWRVGSDHGVMIAGEEWAIIAVAGSDDADDWKSNGRIAKRLTGHGRAAHAGFVEAAQSILAAGVLPTVWRTCRVHIVGHSRGGAIAMLLAEALHRFPIFNTQVVTFGAPRVFGPWSELPRDMRVWRVEHAADPVPWTPSALRFRHQGHRVWLDDDGTYTVNPSLWQRAAAVWRSYRLGDLSHDHLRESYRRALQNCRWAEDATCER
jgi:pimeloyl-ACP methyl ester carboxylesterase